MTKEEMQEKLKKFESEQIELAKKNAEIENIVNQYNVQYSQNLDKIKTLNGKILAYKEVIGE